MEDRNAFRGNKMAQLKQATDQARTLIEGVVARNRTEVVEAIESRKAEIEASAFYSKAASAAQESVLRRVDQTLARVRAQNQIALIRETGSSFEQRVYPGLLDQLADGQPQAREGDGDDGRTQLRPKQTVSVKTISATGVYGVLETEADVERYIDALRAALLKTLNTGKRISL